MNHSYASIHEHTIYAQRQTHTQTCTHTDSHSDDRTTSTTMKRKKLCVFFLFILLLMKSTHRASERENEYYAYVQRTEVWSIETDL